MTLPTLTYIPNDDFLADIATLSRAIRASGWAPDFIIGIGRGGLTPGTFLSHALGYPMLSVDHSTAIPDFSDDLLANLARRGGEGQKLLFVDDINDSGRTIRYIRRALSEGRCDPRAARFAVLIDNLRSEQQVDYRSRSIDRNVVKDWFVFPWEAVAPTDTILEDSREVPERTQ